MKQRLCLMLLCAALLFAGCAPQSTLPGNAAATLVPGTDPIQPGAQAPAALNTQESATLYFRFMDEPFLAPETRVITSSPSRPYELSLLTELFSGPGTRSTDLKVLFPAGTRVLATSLSGRTLFVTLSEDVLAPYPDETDNPQESILRRQLAMQSIAATVTENCNVDMVQILVRTSAAASENLRLPEGYYALDLTQATPAQPLQRREEMLLTPQNTMQIILQLWSTRDWQRLYNYIALKDPFTGVERVTYRDFVTAMENQPLLMDAACQGGSVNQSGTQATYTLAATLRSHQGQTLKKEGEILRLWREDGLWRVTMSQLTGWLED